MRILRNPVSRYPVVDGKASVELKLRTPRQLFDERDPAPFRERDLDDDAAQYILSSYREIEDPHNVKISLYFESMDDFRASTREIRDAIHAHFAFQANLKRRELKDVLRHGGISLIIGLTFLGICAYFGHGAANKPTDFLGSMRYEAFFIMAWVSMWKPVSTFLYEWWPLAESMQLYRRLSHIEVEVKAREEIRRADDSKAATKVETWRELKVPSTTTA